MARFGPPSSGSPSPGSMVAADINVGVSGSVLKADFSPPSSSFPKESSPMKKEYDFLAAPLAALRAGEVGRAIQMLTELQMVKPDLTDTVYHLGRAHQAAGDAIAARAAYEQVVADPGHTFHAHALARLTELGPPPAAQVEVQVEASVVAVPELVQEAAEAALVAQIAEENNAGVVPPHVAEEATAQADDTAPGEAAPATPAPTGKKGKKGRSHPGPGSTGEAEQA